SSRQRDQPRRGCIAQPRVAYSRTLGSQRRTTNDERGFPMRYAILAVPLALLTVALGPAQSREDKVLRIGIIGLDTSHVTAFTSLLNDPKVRPELAGCKVVAAFPGGSPDIPSSKDRVEGFTKTLRDKYGV